MVRKIIGVVLLFLAAIGIIIALTEKAPEMIIMVVIFGLPGLLLLLLKGKTKAAQNTKMANKARMKKSLVCKHVAGLPLAENAACTVFFEDAGLSIAGGGSDFNVAYDKITDISIKTDVEIQKQYVSSAGGAVGGAMLFGPLGAIVGGRAKQKTSKNIDHYIIVTYLRNESIDYLSFHIEVLQTPRAGSLIKESRGLLNKQRVTVDLAQGSAVLPSPADEDQYIIIATLDGETCPVCGEMDGKVFKQSEYAEGRTAPPFCDDCRCCTAPYYADMADLGERTARNPKTGKTIKVPGSMKYPEYKEKYLDN